jgi:hypothetical protein
VNREGFLDFFQQQFDCLHHHFGLIEPNEMAALGSGKLGAVCGKLKQAIVFIEKSMYGRCSSK